MPTDLKPRKIGYVRLGNSGLKVSKIILGCMSYGHSGWQKWVLGEEEAIEQIKYAYEMGIQTFDTANIYSNGYSEIILGRAIKKLNLPREEIVVMTKVFFPLALVYDFNTGTMKEKPDTVGFVNQRGLSRKHIFDSIKASLKRLDLEYVDLLQCHRFDYETPIEETMQALHDVVQAGLARYIGMSSCYAYQFHAMQNYAIQNKLTPFVSMQNQYSLIYREEEREMFPTLKLFGVGSIPWSPLGRGLLARPYGAQTVRTDSDPNNRNIKGDCVPEVIGRVEELAKTKGVSMAQLALAWVLRRPGVTAPIIGTTSLENLKELIGALDIQLTDDEAKHLEEQYRPQGVVGFS